METKGKFPEEAVVGDIIVLIWGVTMPMILRKYSKHYPLVGFSDVEGMMSGQLWQYVKIEELEEIILC